MTVSNVASIQAYLEKRCISAFEELESYGFSFKTNENQKTPAEQLIQFALMGEVTLDKDPVFTKIVEEIQSC